MDEIEYRSVPIVCFTICDDDEHVYHVEDSQSYADSVQLLKKLRIENPDIEYMLIAEIAA